MPTRILYWNINNFSLPKIFSNTNPALAAEATSRRNEIVNNVVVAAAPQIFIIVEVYSRIREVGFEGSVLGSGRTAGSGALRLLYRIRGILGNNWALVPPLNLGELGQREAVAVYYNAATLQFMGPNIWYRRWPGTGIGQAQPIGPGTQNDIIDYPTNWRRCLPFLGNPIGPVFNRHANFVVAGVPVAVPECQLAGQWEYYNPGVARPIPSPIPPPYAPGRLFFPNADCRGPFWTSFNELATGRTLNLFTVHTSPSTARQAIWSMQQAAELSGAPQPNEVKVVLGDFNADPYGANAHAYNWMIVAPGNYTMELDPRDNTGVVNPNRKPYLMTHLLPTVDATPYNPGVGPPDPQQNVYPRFGYMGSSFPQINDAGAIDNFFTWYGGGIGPPLVNNITIVNRIVGKPYNAVMPAPPGVTVELTGGVAFAQGMNNAIPLPGGVAPGAPIPTFPNWNNYGKFRSISDHLPLLLDV